MSVLVLVEPGEELSVQAVSLARDLGGAVHALSFTDSPELGAYGVLALAATAFAIAIFLFLILVPELTDIARPEGVLRGLQALRPRCQYPIWIRIRSCPSSSCEASINQVSIAVSSTICASMGTASHVAILL